MEQYQEMLTFVRQMSTKVRAQIEAETKQNVRAHLKGRLEAFTDVAIELRTLIRIEEKLNAVKNA